MKKTLSTIAVMLLSVNLVSCSTNTQGQNTALGAVTGGAAGGLIGGLAGGGAIGIGAGIIAGAVVGGLIGHSMDSTDHETMNHSMDSKTNHTTRWTNPKTGATYTTTPTSRMMTYNGNSNCRRFTTTATIHGKTHYSHGIACLQSNGKWKAVAG
jgi:surface antigen